MADVDMESKLPVRPDGHYVVTDNNEPSTTGLVGVTRGDYSGAGDPKQATNEAQLIRLTGKENAAKTVRALDMALHDENGEAFTQANPLPVVVNDTEGGSPIHHEKTEPALAKDTPTIYDYPVAAGDTFYLHQVLCAASGKARWELQIGDGGVSEVFAKKAVRFNSTAFPNPDVTLAEAIVVVGTVNTTNVRIIYENKDNTVQDLSATIVGTLVPAP